MNKPIHVVAAVIIKNAMVLMASRPADKPPFGWEFPGGKVEPGETLSEAVRRELKEELMLDVIPADEIYLVRTEKIILHFIRTKIRGNSTPTAQENQQWKWIPLTSQAPEGILENDIKFWNFLTFSSKSKNFPNT